jgi:hypothetical protein
VRCFIETMLEAELSEALSRPRPAQAGRGRGGGDDSASPMRGEMADLSFSPPAVLLFSGTPRVSKLSAT